MSYKCSNRLCTAYIVLVAVILLITLAYNSTTKFGQLAVTIKSESPRTGSTQERLHSPPIEDQCRLPRIDPLSLEVLPHLDPSYHPYKNCKPNFTRKTRVNKGKIEVDPEFRDHRCEFRCNYPLNDWNVTLGEWQDVPQTPDCDVFEVRCTDASGSLDYEFLHAQIYMNDSQSESKKGTTDPTKEPTKPENSLPDVYLLVLDSVSTPQIVRSWPKTMRVLEEEMGAVHFRHLNKIGEGSSENAYAMLLGKQALSLPARPGYDAVPADIPMKELCRRPMDEEPYVGYEFSRRGYATMMCEDWYTALNYPDCVGFRKPPADHYFVPFALRYDWSKEGKQSRTLFSNLEHKSCTPQYKYSMAYLKDFIDAYPDRPKWSMTWIVTLAHNNGNSLHFTDDDFETFFKDYKEKMRNAFLFIVGDHGLRFTAIRQTKQGAQEDYNPVTIVVVPEHLRENEQLMRNLRLNSQQLTTHFDLYATLQDVARNAHKMTADTAFDRLDTGDWNVTLHGESFLYLFNKSVARNCANQRVPSEYCLCENKQTDRTEEKQALAVRLARFLVDRMNAELAKQNASSACATLTLDPGLAVDLLDIDGIYYRVTYTTTPGKGRFWADLKVQYEDNKGGAEQFDLENRKIVRLNSYEKQSKCIRTYSVRPYCFCRNLA